MIEVIVVAAIIIFLFWVGTTRMIFMGCLGDIDLITMAFAIGSFLLALNLFVRGEMLFCAITILISAVLHIISLRGMVQSFFIDVKRSINRKN